MMVWGIFCILVWRVFFVSIYLGMIFMVVWRMLCFVNFFRIDVFDV